MLAALQDFQSELARLAEGVDDRDLEDGAGQVIMDLLRDVDDRIERMDILTREDLSAALSFIYSPPEGERRLEEGHMGVLLTAFRLLWAGYYRETVVEERHRWGEDGCRAEAARRFRERVFRAYLP